MYTIRQAALRAGVNVPLLRAWERRYGIVKPRRTASGYRLYDDADIERLQTMRRLVATGWTPSQAAREIETHGVPHRAARRSGARTDAVLDLSRAFVEAAAAFDERQVEAVLDEMFAGGSFERVADDRLMPALRALGDAWAAGTVSVAAEHAASHAALRRVAAAFEAAGGLDAERPVLVGLPPGSRHEIGALAFATAARRRGMPVVYLGADVPYESWLDAIAVTNPRAVVIAIATADDQAAARNVVDAIDTGPPLLIAVGGSASGDAVLPDDVLRLPDGIATSATALEQALSAGAAATPRQRRPR
jgi:DNA-binding transcriptional MerR regulator/methylmalonyl-CoA mutase cobalamin-binding subunit